MPFSRRSRAGSRAFTLLELIVVIVILGVLAAIAIPTFLAAQEKSRAAVAAETLSAEDRDARALMTLRNDGSSVPSADDYATAASELSASGLGTLAASGRRIYVPSAVALTGSYSNVSTYSVAPQLNAGEISLSFSTSGPARAGLSTVTSGGTCVLVVDSGSGPLQTLTKGNLGANCNGASALLTPAQIAGLSYLSAASAPAAPVLAGVWGNQSVTFSWAQPSSNGSSITGYNLYQNGVKISTLAGTALSASVTGLTNGTAYSFTLSAVNAVSEGSQSGALSLTPATLPSAPTAPTLSLSGSTLNISWTAPASNGAAITGYNVYVNGTKSTVSGLSTTFATTPGNTYAVTVSAVNAAGEGPISPSSSLTVLLPATSSLTATASTSALAVSLSWTAVSGASTYNVYRGTAVVASVTAPTTSYTDTGLSADTAYSYQVSSVDANAHEGALSIAASATTTGTPGTVTSVRALNNSATTVEITWQPTSDSATYTIQRSTDGSTGWTTVYSGVGITDNVGNWVYAIDNNATTGTKYWYRVLGVNPYASGTPSANSSWTTAQTSTNTSPAGSYDSLTSTSANTFTVDGWEYTPAQANAARGYVIFLNGTKWYQGDNTAQFNGDPFDTSGGTPARLDVQSANPGSGQYVGFHHVVGGIVAGTYNICVTAINANLSTSLGCKSITVTN